MTTTFDEVQFPPDIRWGVKGGPEFSTTVLESTEGFEFRNRNWSQPLRSWDCTQGVKYQSELDILAAFFLARGGRERGFRFKDWSDYKSDMNPSPTRLLLDDPNGGENYYQLHKIYSDAGATHIRPITKPVDGTIVITTETEYAGEDEFTATENLDYTIDYTTGVVTWVSTFFDNGASAIVSNPMQVTLTKDHDLTTGQSVYFFGISGYTTSPDIYRNRFKVTVTGLQTFTVDDVNCTVAGSQMYVRGVIPGEERIYWGGEFDVPVRFDQDTMQTSIDSWMMGEGQSSHGYTWKKISVTEVRDPLPLAFSNNNDAGDITHPEVTSSFHEVQFDPEIAYKSLGGPGFKTIIFTGYGGAESRFMNWDQQRGQYNVSHNLKTFEEYIAIQEFFHARWGRAFGFRFKDWSDYKHDMSDTPSDMLTDTVGDNTVGPYQITKLYTSSNTFSRKITKPIDGTCTWKLTGPTNSYTIIDADNYDNRDTVYTTDNGTIIWYTDYTEDDVTVTPGNPTAFTCASPHGLFNITGSDGSVYVKDATGTGASLLNDIRHPVLRTGSTTFTVAVDTTALTVVDCNISIPPDPAETFSWSGEFDVPVRFDTDSMDLELQNYGIFTWGKIKLVEIRQD